MCSALLLYNNATYISYTSYIRHDALNAIPIKDKKRFSRSYGLQSACFNVIDHFGIRTDGITAADDYPNFVMKFRAEINSISDRKYSTPPR